MYILIPNPTQNCFGFKSIQIFYNIFFVLFFCICRVCVCMSMYVYSQLRCDGRRPACDCASVGAAPALYAQAQRGRPLYRVSTHANFFPYSSFCDT